MSGGGVEYYLNDPRVNSGEPMIAYDNRPNVDPRVVGFTNGGVDISQYTSWTLADSVNNTGFSNPIGVPADGEGVYLGSSFPGTSAADDYDMTYRFFVTIPDGGGGSGGGDSGGGSGPVCFLGNAAVLTPTGYRRIDSLKLGEVVCTGRGSGGSATIDRILKKSYDPSPSSNPFVIPEGKFGATQRLLISPRHRVCVKGDMIEARDLGLVQEARSGTITYYNIGITGWANMIVCGVEVESLAPIVTVKMSLADFEKAVKTQYGKLTAEMKSKCQFLADGTVRVPTLKN